MKGAHKNNKYAVKDDSVKKSKKLFLRVEEELWTKIEYGAAEKNETVAAFLRNHLKNTL